MKIKISRRKSPPVPGSEKKSGGERKAIANKLPSVTDSIYTTRAIFWHFSFIPQRRDANDESWMIKHRPTYTNCRIKKSGFSNNPLNPASYFKNFFSIFRYSVAKTTPRERFHAFLVQVPTKRCEPEMDCHKRNTNVIVMKKQKIRASSQSLWSRTRWTQSS